MKFMLDAPLSICNLFHERGCEAIHTKQLLLKNKTSDTEIIKIAEQNNYIVITKDSDFYYSHLIKNKPKKLLLIRTGNISTKNLKVLFNHFSEQIINTFNKQNLLELHTDSMVS